MEITGITSRNMGVPSKPTPILSRKLYFLTSIERGNVFVDYESFSHTGSVLVPNIEHVINSLKK